MSWQNSFLALADTSADLVYRMRSFLPTLSTVCDVMRFSRQISLTDTRYLRLMEEMVSPDLTLCENTFLADCFRY